MYVYTEFGWQSFLFFSTKFEEESPTGIIKWLILLKLLSTLIKLSNRSIRNETPCQYQLSTKFFPRMTLDKVQTRKMGNLRKLFTRLSKHAKWRKDAD